MLKIKLGEVKGIYEGLEELAKEKLPIKTSFKVSRAILKLQPDYLPFEESRVKIINKHAAKDEKGQLKVENGLIVFEHPAEFTKDYNELASTDIEIDIKPLKLDELGNITLAPKTLLALDKVIKE